MIKRKIIILTTCLLLGTLLILSMVIISDRNNHKENAFIRLLPPHPLDNYYQLDLQYNSYYIAGATATHIFLGNYTAPMNLLIADYSLKDTQHLILKIPEDNKIAWGALKVSIDSPNIYLIEGISPLIIRGTFPLNNPVSYTPKNKNLNRSIAISPTSFVFKVSDTLLENSILVKEQFQPSIIKAVPEALEKQIDGTFCVDGSLHYDRLSGRIVYTYLYRNQFICLDSNLNILYRGRTIDTNSVAKIEVAILETKESKTKKLAAPPQIINKYSSVSLDKIYINSQLKANNETKVDFEKSSVIDVYSLDNGRYQRSFYLPNPYKKKISDFKVYDRKIVVLNGQYLSTFELLPY